MKTIYKTACPWVFVAFIVLVLPAAALRAQEDTTEEAESSWTASAHTLYQNKDNSRGVDLSNDLAMFLYGVRVEHTAGFSLDVSGANLLGSGGGFERWIAALGYTYSATTWLTLSGEFSKFKYKDDSLNAIANLNNSLTLGITFPTKIVNVGLSYNTYFGGGTASYFGLNLDHTYQSGKLTVNPSLNSSLISQTIDQKRLVTYKKILKSGRGVGKPGTSIPTSVTVSGLSGITLSVALAYELGTGFAVSLQPTYVYSPKAELAANTSEFLWSVGLTYSRQL